MILSKLKKWTCNYIRLIAILKWFYSFYWGCWGYHINIIAVTVAISIILHSSLKKLLLSTYWILVHFKMADIKRERLKPNTKKKAFSIFLGKVTLKKSPRNILRVMKISTLNLYIIHVTCILRAVYSKFQTLVKVSLRFQGSWIENIHLFGWKSGRAQRSAVLLFCRAKCIVWWNMM